MEQLAVYVGVSREYPEEDHAVGPDLAHLGDPGIGVIVAHDEVAPDLDRDAGLGVVEMPVRQATLVDPGEINPHVPYP